MAQLAHEAAGEAPQAIQQPAAAPDHEEKSVEWAAAMEAYKRREREALDFIESATSNAQAVQDQVLAAILSRNANTEYLQRYGLEGRTDKATFRRLLPVITYEDLQPEIQRIANGDTSPILSSQPISEFLTSSGTSAGERKLMPTISEEFERRTLLYSLLMPVMNQYLPDLHKGKGMFFLFIRPEAKTPGGLLARPVLTSFYKSPYFTKRPYDPYNVLTSPNEVVLCPDAHQTMYCHLMCGLLQRHQVLRMGAVFASGFIRAIRFLEEHWPALVEDIRHGQLSSKYVTDPSSRAAVEQLILASPAHSRAAAADAVARECGNCNWQGIITRLWPNAKYIEVVITGTMAQYIPTLDYYSGGLPLASTMYASSECYFGINLKPLCRPSEVTYTLLPNMCYYEFLPVKRNVAATLQHLAVDSSFSTEGDDDTATDGDRNAQLVDLQDVKIGHEYELVLTTYAGLYRYRVGDVLKVTGFYNKAPQFHFVCRKNVVLSIDADKTDEQDLHSAVESAVRQHLDPADARLIEYTSYADTSSIPGHYVLYWELRSDNGSNDKLDARLFQECCFTLEESLDVIYRAGRVEGSIGPLEIKLVKPGTFDALMDYALSRGASINQYKTPRCIKFNPIVELLNARVAASYFSPRLPHWASYRP